MKRLGIIICLVLLTFTLASCGAGSSPFHVEISGAMSFDTRAIFLAPNSTNEYALLELLNTNPDDARPTAGGYLSIYGLPHNGAGDYELREFPGGTRDPVVVLSFVSIDRENSFADNPTGTFSVTAFDGTKLSCTFDFTVEDESGEQIRVRGTLNDIPYNGEVFAG